MKRMQLAECEKRLIEAEARIKELEGKMEEERDFAFECADPYD